jgi:DNA polymerase III subunit epsilon
LTNCPCCGFNANKYQQGQNMLLFIDTETTGFPLAHTALDHEAQPHIVQIAAVLTTIEGESVAQMVRIIDNDVAIPEQASDVHKITQGVAAERGFSPDIVMRMFSCFLEKSSKIVAHNAKFDVKMLNIALSRAKNARALVDLSNCEIYCTMEAAAPIVNLPPTEKMIKAGFNKPKSPSLAETYDYFFGEKLDGAHDALVDVMACKRIYFELMERDARHEETKRIYDEAIKK